MPRPYAPPRHTAKGIFRVPPGAQASEPFVSLSKRAPRFENARFEETLSALPRTTVSIAFPIFTRPAPKRSFATRFRSQSAALTLGTRGNGDLGAHSSRERGKRLIFRSLVTVIRPLAA
jgi:hypothetical protein